MVRKTLREQRRAEKARKRKEREERAAAEEAAEDERLRQAAARQAFMENLEIKAQDDESRYQRILLEQTIGWKPENKAAGHEGPRPWETLEVAEETWGRRSPSPLRRRAVRKPLQRTTVEDLVRTMTL